MSRYFSLADMPDMTGKTVVVTGATMGLGYHSARVFASHGARVLVHGRTAEKAGKAVEQLQAETGSEELVAVHGDLSSLDSVKKLANAISKATKRIDVLMLNAGVAGLDFELSQDGIEMHMAVNYVAHFYLFKKLEHTLKVSKARVVSVSSGAAASTCHAGGVPLSLEAWNNKAEYNELRSYGDSKLANILFTKYVAEHYGSAGIVATVVDPGVVWTALNARAAGSSMFSMFLRNVAWFFSSKPEEAVLTQIFASVSPRVENGTSWQLVCLPWDVRGKTQGEGAALLWKMTEKVLREKGFA